LVSGSLATNAPPAGDTSRARRVLLWLLLCVLFPCGLPAWADEKPTRTHVSSDRAFQLNVYEGPSGVRIEVQNLEPFPITATLTVGEQENLAFSEPLPQTLVLAAKARADFVTFSARDATKSWRYGKVRCTYQIGSIKVRPRAFDYELPYPRGKSYRVDQAFDGAFSHKGKNALDFALAEGDIVTAARAGQVVKVTDHHREGGAEERFRGKANRVWVLHEDGTFGCYAHFRHKGIRVKVGAKVKVGQVLGEAGQTGYAQGAHLHFEVRYAKRGRTRAATVPITFRTALGEGQTLREGRSYERPVPKAN
jgi:murein DD-endopeptidase MepM/ murein hydrolase activator NlpD